MRPVLPDNMNENQDIQDLDKFFLLSRDLICTLDDKGNFLTGNLAFRKILGIPKGKVHKYNFYDLVDPEDRLESRLKIEKAFQYPSTIINMENKCISLKKEEVWLEWSIKVQKENRELLCLARDITRRRLMEQKINQSSRLEAVGRLSGGIAHDFNNILNGVMGFSDLLLMKTDKDDERYYFAKAIRDAAERAAELTQKLLAFSRKQILKTEVAGYNNLISGLEIMLNRLLGEQIQIRTSLAPDLFNVEADLSQLEQVIMNLAINARDAMPAGGELRITTFNSIISEYDRNRDIPPGNYAVLEVGDNGMGMDRRIQRQIFEPFFTTKTIGKGTGLGLSTVYGIVKQTGGYILVQSVPDQGSVFSIYLPATEKNIEPLVELSNPQPVIGETGTGTILVVEDEDMVRDVVVRSLQSAGYTALSAETGEDALEHPQLGEVELLITDLVMPGMGGKILAEIIHERYPGIPILFISGYMEDTFIQRRLTDSDFPLLAKPFSQYELLGKVRQLMRGDTH